MKKAAAIVLVFMGIVDTYGQLDTTQLPSVQITDHKIVANGSNKQQQINLDSLNRLGRFNLGQVLQNNTGIFVKSYGGNGVATLSFRGTGANHTRVFWNNLDISSPSLGLADLSTLPALAFSDLNIQYGAASLSDGSGALGGSLRLGNSLNFKNKFKLSLSQIAGSFNQWQSALQVGGSRKKWAYNTKVYRYQAANNFSFIDITEANQPTRKMRHSQFRQEGLMQEVLYRPKANQRFSLKAWYNETARQLPPPITGNLARYDSLTDQQLSAIAQYQIGFSKINLLMNSGFVGSRNAFFSVGDSSTSNNRFSSWQNNIRLAQTLSSWLKVDYGLRYRLDAVTSPAFTQKEQRHTSSFFSDFKADISTRWSADFLLRQEFINNFTSPLMGAVGLVFKASSSQSFKLSLARNFRYPTLNDWFWQPGGNPNLKPEESWQSEFNYQYKIGEAGTNPSFTFGFTLFTALVDNWIQWVPIENYTGPKNLRKVQNTGLEFNHQGRWQWGAFKLSEQINYSYLRSQTAAVYGVGEKAQQLSYVPFQRASLGLGLSYKKWQVLYNQNFTDYYFTTATNDVYMPAYSVSQLSLRCANLLKNTKHQVEGTFSLFNLFNKPYQVLPYRPEPGLNFNLQITYTFAR